MVVHLIFQAEMSTVHGPTKAAVFQRENRPPNPKGTLKGQVQEVDVRLEERGSMACFTRIERVLGFRKTGITGI